MLRAAKDLPLSTHVQNKIDEVVRLLRVEVEAHGTEYWAPVCGRVGSQAGVSISLVENWYAGCGWMPVPTPPHGNMHLSNALARCALVVREGERWRFAFRLCDWTLSDEQTRADRRQVEPAIEAAPVQLGAGNAPEVPSVSARSGLADKMRVHILAKELNVSSKAIIDKCQAEGIDRVQNHMSTLSAGLYATIKDWFNKEHADPVRQAVAPATNAEVDPEHCVTGRPLPADQGAKPVAGNGGNGQNSAATGEAPPRSKSLGHPVPPVFNEAYLIREFDRRERERGPIFAGFIVNDLLPRMGFNASDAKRILRAMEAQNMVRTEQRTNPKQPERTTTFVTLNHEHPHVARVLKGAAGIERKFPICSIEGEPLSQTIIRERL